MSKIASRPPPAVLGRFTQAGFKAMEAKLKKLDGQITRAKGAVSAQVKMMTTARFTADGYKKATAELKTLQKAEAKLETERKHLLNVMTHG